METIKTSLSGVPLLRVIGEVDHSTAPALDEVVQKALPLDDSHLILDLSECPYLDSGGLGVILMAVRKVQAGGWLGVIARNANLLRLFEISGLTTEPAFRIFAGPREASAVLAGEDT